MVTIQRRLTGKARVVLADALVDGVQLGLADGELLVAVFLLDLRQLGVETIATAHQVAVEEMLQAVFLRLQLQHDNPSVALKYPQY